jgi:hypothetical protein
LGEKRENVVVDVLKKVYGENMVSKVGGLNSSEDMTSGVDAIINTSTGTKTAQVKPFYKTTKNYTTIVFSDTGNVKEYKTDYIIFDGAKEVYVMNNDKTKIVNGQYTFPIESVLHILSK